jgi:hypothetical protein
MSDRKEREPTEPAQIQCQTLQNPEQWAAECGHTKARKLRGLGESHQGTAGFSARHLAAYQAHGWGEHAQHTTDPLRINKADYLAALEATGKGAIHQPAESPLALRARAARRATNEGSK